MVQVIPYEQMFQYSCPTQAVPQVQAASLGSKLSTGTFDSCEGMVGITTGGVRLGSIVSMPGA